MAVRIGVGGEFFDRLRENKCYYVDKTELLYELVHETDNAVTLFTRPRRFGKTLTMSMMECFFDITKDSRDIFAGLDIMKHEEFCAEWMNQYPVLSVSFKDVEGLTYSKAYNKLKMTLADVCKKYIVLMDHSETDIDDRNTFARLKSQTASNAELQGSLKAIMRMMKAVYGKPVILLIDEYDVPLAKANAEKEGGERYYPQMMEVMRGILSTALKSNDYLKFGVVTGCLRIAKESIFTGVNNFKSYSVLDDRFSQYFGFTQEELDRLLYQANLEEKATTFREWYDGYVFGWNSLYCPWDVLNYVSDLSYRKTAKPKNYWKNTSSNAIIRNFIERTEFPVKKKFETLMNGGNIVQTISDELTYDTFHETEDNLWSVLLMTGYLTKADPEEEGGDITSLRIPNREIASIFQDTVVKYFSDHVNADVQKAMMEALWAGDEKAASDAISHLLWQTISYMDYHEDYYNAFLAGIFVGRGYEVESNKERGLGRPDIKLTDDVNRRILIIEAKKSNSKGQMGHACKEALQQIVDMEYAKNLDAYTVICYGIAFFQKSALVLHFVSNCYYNF
ncbi:MAG: AAA family ATPase [Blautia sp.]|nr:AAA family ATPase [Blautia sp.]